MAANIQQVQIVRMRVPRPLLPVVVGLLVVSCVHRSGTASSSAACIVDPKPAGFESVLTIASGAATRAVDGVVVVRESNAPLPDADVWINPPHGRAARTAADGRFMLGELAPGRYAILMRRIGFESLRDSITVPVNGRLQIEARQSMLDGGCDGLGSVRTADP